MLVVKIYRLSDTSPYKNAGNDVKDLGADFDAIAGAVSGSQNPIVAPQAPNKLKVVDVTTPQYGSSGIDSSREDNCGLIYM